MILVTGGTGFIGSHTCVALAEAGYQTLIYDNLCNSKITVLDALEQLNGTRPLFIEGDIRDENKLNKIFGSHSISAIIHFAGLKAVGESNTKPLEYHSNNVGGSIALLRAMQKANIKTLVFSSSATVYGNPASVPIQEHFPRSATNPYGRTKLIIEDILQDLSDSAPEWRIARLRYFNPVGAHPSGLIGEEPTGAPNNLFPYIAQAAAGIRDRLRIFGNDYPTPDGTGVRDYIHVMDLAAGHVAALKYLENHASMLTVNLGTGRGTSVLQAIHAFETTNDIKVPHEIASRRAGDVAECWADCSHAYKQLGWKARRDLSEMCKDVWQWQQKQRV